MDAAQQPCFTPRIMVWDYGAGDYYDRKAKRGSTKRRLCPTCLDYKRIKTAIPHDSESGQCDNCAATTSNQNKEKHT